MTEASASSASLVTFGESMLRLAVTGGERLEMTDSLHLAAAGAESNVAVAASRLGVDATWISKLPDSPLSRRITGSLRQHGVTPNVIEDDDGRVGTYYIEPGDPPQGTSVIYDRRDASIRSTTFDELPREPIRDADVFYTSGITPALSETVATTTRRALERATAVGTRTAFDLNYRSKLWSPTTARETCESVFPAVDTFIVATRDAQNVLGFTETGGALATALAAEYDFETVIITQGADGATAWHDSELTEQPAFDATTVDPIGTGDAFVGGFLARRLAGDTVPAALEYAAATAALKRTLSGDLAVVTDEEVRAVLGGSDGPISR